jgi:hypothetical protein
MSGDIPLPFDVEAASEEPGPDAPCIYVATRITGTTLGSPEREMIRLAVVTIRDAIVDLTRDATDPWAVRVHAPVEWTSPELTPQLRPAHVYDRNADIVFGDADALIVYGCSPSAGIGQEFTWATQLGLPVLYLEPAGHPVSRQIRGTPGDVTVNVCPPDALKDIVRSWVRSRRHQIESGPVRRRSRALSVAPLYGRLTYEWFRRNQGERRAVAANIGVHPKLLELWLQSQFQLAMAPVTIVRSLTMALTGSLDALNGMHPLSLDQMEALLTARDEHGWDAATTTALRHRAERELALPAIRRFRLETPIDWVRLKDATGL